MDNPHASDGSKKAGGVTLITDVRRPFILKSLVVKKEKAGA